MLWWMVLLLLLLICSVVGSILWIGGKEYKRYQENEAFFMEMSQSGTETDLSGNNDDNEAMTGMVSYQLPKVDIVAYDKAKLQMYEKYAGPQRKFNFFADSSDSEDDDNSDNDDTGGEGCHTAACSVGVAAEPNNTYGEGRKSKKDTEPWQRSIPPDAKKTLKTLLMKRAMATIPCMRQLSSEFNVKSRLNQLQLMAQLHWKKIEVFRDEVTAEISFIRAEAESIEHLWGASDRIFREANLFHQHNLTKAVRAKEAARKEIEDREDKNRQQKLAEKMMKGLLKQEEVEKQNQLKAEQSAKTNTTTTVKQRGRSAQKVN